MDFFQKKSFQENVVFCFLNKKIRQIFKKVGRGLLKKYIFFSVTIEHDFLKNIFFSLTIGREFFKKYFYKDY